MTQVKFLIEKEHNPDFEPSVFAFFLNDKFNDEPGGITINRKLIKRQPQSITDGQKK